MGRFRLFAVAAATATVAGLTAPVAVVAAAAAPGHTLRPHHSTSTGAAPARSGPAVQWSAAANGKVSGLVRYPGGTTARITQHKARPADSIAGLRAVAVQAARKQARPAVSTADVPPADQATISGQVTDSQHHPLGGVLVEAFVGDSAEPGNTTPTDPTGHYTFTLAPGAYFIGFDGSNATGGNSDATGYVATGEQDELTANEDLVRDAVLQPGAQLKVTVTDQSGNPLAGVSPYLQPIMPYVESLTGGDLSIVEFSSDDVTGPDGTFTFRGMPSDAGLMCFSTSGDNVTGGAHDALGYASRCSRHPIALAPGSFTTLPAVRLDTASGGALHGVVANGNGQPIADAFVVASGQRDDAFVQTTPNGSYRVTGLSPGPYQLCAFGPAVSGLGFAPRCTAAQVVLGKSRRADVTLHRGGAISGTVTGPTGAPVVGAEVDVTGPGINGGAGITDADGHYLANGLATGGYRVCVDPSGAVDADSPTGDLPRCFRHKAEVAVHAGSVRHDIDVQLRVGGAIGGQVTGAGGAGLADIDVVVEPLSGNSLGGSVVTDQNGNYQVTGLPAGSYFLCMFSFDPTSGGAQKCDKTPVDVQVSQTTNRDESLAPPSGRGSIAVSVRDEQGRRVQGVDVGVLKRCTGSQPDPFACQSEPLFGHTGHAKLVASEDVDNAGTAQIDDRKPGRYAVCLFAYYGVTTAGAPPAGYTDRCAGIGFTVTVAAGGTTHIHLTLHPGGRVEGRVVDIAGDPVSHVSVQVAHSAAADYVDELAGLVQSDFSEPSPLADAQTHKNGTFSVRGVRPGRDAECVQVKPDSKYLASCARTPLTVQAGATTHAPDLALHLAGAISGVVRNATGHPLDLAVVVLFAAGGQHELQGVSVVNRHGHYRAHGLGAGRYLVCFAAPHRATECYRQVRWHLKHSAGPPSNATKVRVSEGHTTTGIDAELRRLK